jgi:hypothetical protein
MDQSATTNHLHVNIPDDESHVTDLGESFPDIP